MATERHRFLADAMLIRLGRWLRVLGYDTLCAPHPEDRHLVARANDEGRWLLTRDRALLRELHPNQGLFIHSQRPLAQLDEVDAAVGLALPDRLFCRCLLCNTPLQQGLLPGDHLPDPTPDGPYWHCPGCHKSFWAGHHTRRMRATLARHWPHRLKG